MITKRTKGTSRKGEKISLGISKKSLRLSTVYSRFMKDSPNKWKRRRIPGDMLLVRIPEEDLGAPSIDRVKAYYEQLLKSANPRERRFLESSMKRTLTKMEAEEKVLW